mgnify:CR=1 FL=1
MVFFNKRTIFLTLLFSFMSAFATDYKALSTDELMKLRGTVLVEDLEVYSIELTKRVKKMDTHELEKYKISHLIKGKNDNLDVECSCNDEKLTVQNRVN